MYYIEETSPDLIKDYLVSNYEVILTELLPFIEHRDNLVKDDIYDRKEINSQFRYFCGSIIIDMINKNCPNIPLEDVVIYIRSLDIENFITMQVQNVLP